LGEAAIASRLPRKENLRMLYRSHKSARHALVLTIVIL